MPCNGQPKVWVLMGHRAGDNTQVLSLAEALGWSFEIKRLVYRKYERAINLLLGASLATVVKSESSPLTPPWPEVVVSAGRRNEPASLWIKKQSRGYTRLVHVGRPWARYERFDLVITTPQYRLPEHPVVLHNTTPLHRMSEDRLSESAARWAPRLSHLPRPYIAVVVGGSSGPYTFDARAAERLGLEASAMASAHEGSLLVTTSARTSAIASESLVAAITCPAHVFRWAPNCDDNPYFGYLALADSIIVTGDSMSMLSEACATRKPVYIFDLGEGPNAMRPLESSASERGKIKRSLWRSWDRDYLRSFLYRQMMRIGPQRLTRDIRIIHDILISSGRAVWLGETFPPLRPPPLDDIPRAVARIHAWFEPSTTHHDETPNIGVPSRSREDAAA